MATTSASQTPQAPSREPGGVAGVLAELVGRLDARSTVGRPVALEFWDGSVLPPTTNDPTAPTLRFTTPDALV
ncbi:MAG: hypothetical protein ACKOH7_06545, partial [Solirubrobacterales bacterium]